MSDNFCFQNSSLFRFRCDCRSIFENCIVFGILPFEAQFLAQPVIASWYQFISLGKHCRDTLDLVTCLELSVRKSAVSGFEPGPFACTLTLLIARLHTRLV